MSESVEGSEAAGAAFALCPPGEGGENRRPKASNATGHGRRYKQGTPRTQAMLLPPSVEDYVAADNPVRAIDLYVESLDLVALGFANAAGTLSAGQPAYRPADLLKLYIYGYLNRVRSSRRLQAECGRNLELIWLLGGLAPNDHTIADFRKDNAEALRATCRDFVALCAELGAIGGTQLGLDGSFFHGSASDASVTTAAQLAAELAALERDIERYHSELDGHDTEEASAPERARATAAALDELKARAERRRAQLKRLADTGETQVSNTDPDARRLRKNGQKVTGYNVQSVVDARHKLILAHEVTNAGNDLGQLVPMLAQAQAVLAERAAAPSEAPAETAPSEGAPDVAAQPAPLEVLADAGYFTERDIAACETRGIRVYVPVPEAKGNSAERRGLLPTAEFRYDPERDRYDCPGGRTLERAGKPVVRNGALHRRYRSKAKVCAACPLAERCLSEKGTCREIERSEHAEAVERHRAHMQSEQAKAKMRERAALCEHPFGTLKRWLGWDHFLVRGFDKVRGEMALLVQCYNLRRLLVIFGIEGFLEACRQRRQARQAEAHRDPCWACALAFFPLARATGRFWGRFGSNEAMPPLSARARAWTPPGLAVAA
jgi:transposase